MSQVSTIEHEIEELWRDYFADAHRDPPSLSEWRTTPLKLQQEATTKAELLQPWLAIFEFGLQWLGRVHLALCGERKIGPRIPEYRPAWALVGAACAFGWGVRNSCVTGFDTPGRALLRTYVESLFLCLAILYDKSLGDAYKAADSDEKVVTFWHTLASPKNLHRRIIQIEGSLGFTQDMITQLTAWRRAEYEVMSQSSHLSYLAACMTCAPVSIESDQLHQVGIFGRASANSLRTIDYAARTAWYFSRLSYDKLIGPVGSSDALFVVDKEDENHQAIVIGRDVLSAIIGRHWNE